MSGRQIDFRRGVEVEAREALDAGVAIEDVYRDAVAETKRTYALPNPVAER